MANECLFNFLLTFNATTFQMLAVASRGKDSGVDSLNLEALQGNHYRAIIS